MPHRLRSPAAAGFTLIEILVTLAVFAVILTLGIPNLRSMLARSELTQAGRQVEVLVQKARREAVKREATALVSQDGREVTGWVDVDENGVRDGADDLLGSFRLPPGVDWVDPMTDFTLLPNGAASTLGSYGLGNEYGDTLRVRLATLATGNVEYERNW